MKTKNHIKSPKEDTLRGIGRLGWTEGSKMNSTIKRLESSFTGERVRSIKTNKKESKCPHCRFRFHSNNTDRVPTHNVQAFHFSYHQGEERNICQGSYIKQPTGEVVIEQLDFIKTSHWPNQVIRPGDTVLVDLTLKGLSKYAENGNYSIIESSLLKIEKISPVLNDGSIGSGDVFAYFENISLPISNYDIGRNITLYGG